MTTGGEINETEAVQHRTLSDVRMTDKMNVSLVNNGEKQGSVRSEDREALKLVEMERSPVSKWRWSTSSYYCNRQSQESAVSGVSVSRSAAARPISRFGLRSHFRTTSYGRQSGNQHQMRHSKSSGSHFLLRPYLFLLRHRIYPTVFIN